MEKTICWQKCMVSLSFLFDMEELESDCVLGARST